MRARVFGFAFAMVYAAIAAAPAPTSLPPFSSSGTVSVTAQANGKNVGVQMDVRVAHLDARTRVDVTKFTVTTQDAQTNRMVAAMLPKGPLSVLIDTKARTLTVWSVNGRQYYQTKLFSTVAPNKKPTSKRAAPTSPWTDVGNALRSMTQLDKFSSTMELVGDQPVNGHMAHVFRAALVVQKHTDKQPTQVTSTFALADDLSGIPVQAEIDFSGATPKSSGAGTAAVTMKMNLADIALTAPQASTFTLPAGYSRTSNLMITVMGSMPSAPMATPKPLPTKTA